MAKYVEVEKVKKMLHSIGGGCGAEPGSWADGWDKAIDTAIGELDKLPAADVAPIVHANWEREDRKYALHKFRCSNCKCSSPIDIQQFLTDYCGNCSAKMDGKDGG